MNDNSIARNFNPFQNLEGKNNFQRFILVDKDGNTNTRIILFIPNIELREQIICDHFLSRYVQIFIKETVGIRFISKDKPWDFELELSNDERLIIEITSIADEINLFKTFKYQERIIQKSKHENIPLHELIKLNFQFPDSEIDKSIEIYKEQKLRKNDLVPNPHFGKHFIFQSRINEDLEKFEKIIKESINKKVDKIHPDKEKVTLIIDNRTVSFNLESIQKYLNELDEFFQSLPFKEVWMYTGYYSDLDSKNSEYSLAPLKIDHKKLEKLISELKE